MAKLPHPNDPYITTDGKLLTPNVQTEDTTLDPSREALPRLKRFMPVKTRHKDDRPELDVKQQAVLCAVIGYRLMGYEIEDIADFFDLSVHEIVELLNKTTAQKTFEMMVLNIINHNADNLQGRIASHAHKAVDVLLELMDDKEQHGMVRLKASQDVLDRSGANANQFFNNINGSQRADDELNIVIMSEEDKTPKVEVNIKRGR